MHPKMIGFYFLFAQSSSDFLCDLSALEGFAEKFYASIQSSIAYYDVFRVSGCKQDLQSRINFHGPVGQFFAVDAWHDDVREK